MLTSEQLAAWEREGFSAVAIAPQNARKGESGLELLGLAVARRLRVPLRRPFAKVRGHTQHGRTLSGRMDGPCFVRLRRRVEGKTLLLDDVYTTGTTLDQCAYLLRRAGGGEVVAYSLARQVVQRLERKQGEAREEGEEMDPFLLHLFV